MAGTHFTGPLLNDGRKPARAFIKDFPLGIEPDYVSFFEDFIGDVLADDTATWTIVKDTSATVAQGADAALGTVVITSQATTDDDGGSIQLEEEFFRLTEGKKAWFETRVQVSDGDDMDCFWGVCNTFATNPEAAALAANRVGFQIDDGDATIRLITEDGSTESETVSATDIVDATYTKLSFFWDGVATVYFYIDREYAGKHTTNIPTDENMTIGIYHISGSATGTKSQTIDYVWAAMER